VTARFVQPLPVLAMNPEYVAVQRDPLDRFIPVGKGGNILLHTLRERVEPAPCEFNLAMRALVIDAMRDQNGDAKQRSDRACHQQADRYNPSIAEPIPL
jgi:hypothetical protein